MVHEWGREGGREMRIAVSCLIVSSFEDFRKLVAMGGLAF